ncbi:flagellar brake protein [Massilia sp. YMA4]|uniref:flagellar brake protein n=1 Tax=Massilia sp. YMA4 TaxID=1593482 RepID=UPI000DD0F70D|nr:flagellar brake protein [Massilia sp. YMA4]AXA92787.1 flagellar brake protein [Massilia sp. YMA4]
MSSSAPAGDNAPRVYEFEQMNLQVGGRVQFITHRTLKPIQHFSSVVGWVKDEYLIVKIPFENGAPIALNEGEKLTLRVFSGVNVCSFSCVVQRVFQRPLYYAHVSFPDQIQGTNLRTAMRVKVDIPAQLKGSAGIDQRVFIVNLSVSGALVETAHELAQNTGDVVLRFTLITQPGNREVMVTTKAIIRNAGTAKAPGPNLPPLFSYGLQFADLDHAHYLMLQNLTYEALIADRQKIV